MPLPLPFEQESTTFKGVHQHSFRFPSVLQYEWTYDRGLESRKVWAQSKYTTSVMDAHHVNVVDGVGAKREAKRVDASVALIRHLYMRDW